MEYIDDLIKMENSVNNSNEKDAMKRVMEAMFAVNDMTLYLDTHPQDRNALDLHNKYVKEYEMAKNIMKIILDHYLYTKK